MSTPSSKTSTGVTTTPPPSPVSAPSHPATADTPDTTTVNSAMFIAGHAPSATFEPLHLERAYGYSGTYVANSSMKRCWRCEGHLLPPFSKKDTIREGLRNRESGVNVQSKGPQLILGHHPNAPRTQKSRPFKEIFDHLF